MTQSTFGFPVELTAPRGKVIGLRHAPLFWMIDRGDGEQPIFPAAMPVTVVRQRLAERFPFCVIRLVRSD